jgi:hypothetical protein
MQGLHLAQEISPPAFMPSGPFLDHRAIVHGFGTRRPIRHERHGTRIAVVKEAHEDRGEAGGMFTDRHRRPRAVMKWGRT